MREIRQAAFDELDGATVFGLARLRQEVFVVEQDCAYPDLDHHDIDQHTVHFWISEGTDVIACLRLLRYGERWRIGRVCCAVGERGRGLSGKLLTAALDRAGPEAEILLHSQTYAAGFYRRYGFVENGPEFMEDGIPHVPMRRLGK